MWIALSRRQSFVSQSWRTSSSTGRSLRSRRALRSWGVISMGELPRRGAANQEVGEPAVDHLSVLDVREMSALVEPAQARPCEPFGHLRAMRGRDRGILATVNEEHRQIQRRDGPTVVGAALD